MSRTTKKKKNDDDQEYVPEFNRPDADSNAYHQKFGYDHTTHEVITNGKKKVIYQNPKKLAPPKLGVSRSLFINF